MRKHGLPIALVAATSLLPACRSQEPGSDPAHREARLPEHPFDDHDHEHGDVGPHGGPLFHLTATALAEVVLGSETGAVKVHLFRENVDPLGIEGSGGTTMILTATLSDGRQVDVPLQPSGGILEISTTSLEGQAEELRDVRAFDGRLTGKLHDLSEYHTVNVVFQWPAPEDPHDGHE